MRGIIALILVLLAPAVTFGYGGEGATCAPTLPNWATCQKSSVPWANLVTNTVNVAAGNYETPFLANAADTKYILQGDISANSTAIQVSNSRIIIDLNGYTITYNEVSAGTGVRIATGSNHNRVAVINGSIIQGADQCEGDLYGHGCNAIGNYPSAEIDSGDCHRGDECDSTVNYGNAVSYPFIANVYAKVSGKDVSVISIAGGNPTIEQVVAEDDYEFGTLKFRDFGTAAIRTRYGDNGLIRYNTVINARQNGISPGDYANVYENYVTTRTISTNGAGIGAPRGGSCYSNTVIARGEHPIGIFGVVKDVVYGETLIYDNDIDIKTTALGNEYGGEYTAHPENTILGNYAVGFRTTWGAKGIRFYSNKITGTSDGNYTGTYSPTGDVAYIKAGVRGLMVGGQGWAGPSGYTGPDEESWFYNNTISTLDRDGTGEAIGADITYNHTDRTYLINNHITSNICNVAIGGAYSWCKGFPLIKNNTQVKANNYPAYKTYANMLGGYFSSQARIVSDTYEGGASETSLQMYASGGSTVNPPYTDIYFGVYNSTTDEYLYYKRVHDNNNTSNVLITDTFDPMISLDYANPGDPPAGAECAEDHLGLCVTESTCTAVGGYWCDGECQSSACDDPEEPVDPEDPTPTPTPAVGSILRIGDSLLRVGDSVLRVQ